MATLNGLPDILNSCWEAPVTASGGLLKQILGAQILGAQILETVPAHIPQYPEGREREDPETSELHCRSRISKRHQRLRHSYPESQRDLIGSQGRGYPVIVALSPQAICSCAAHSIDMTVCLDRSSKQTIGAHILETIPTVPSG
ncbi:hypothetical protein DdX_20289 [Ditylenchus destructor]|uniref:Uncharacterized protein n=1 Tax=Ditylenchus destructor TaxID=166010 RepID=A0AAD4MGG7_9BILA|nr:hypothetical protein DdX_20289 [Ditylenchus destructor]